MGNGKGKQELPISLPQNSDGSKWNRFLQWIRWKRYRWSYIGCLLLLMVLGFSIWKSGETITISSCEQYQSYSLTSLSRVKDLSFISDLECIESLNLNAFSSVASVTIHDNSLRNARSVEMDGLSALSKVTVGRKSLAYASGSIVKNSNQTSGSLRIVNCPKLQSIQIDNYSFSDYHSFELSNLPSLQSVDIGERCFYYASSFSLTSLIE